MVIAGIPTVVVLLLIWISDQAIKATFRPLALLPISPLRNKPPLFKKTYEDDVPSKWPFLRGIVSYECPAKKII